MIYLISGWPGAGKSTVAVQHAIDRYAAAGRRVVANFPIDFSPACRRPKSRLSAAHCQVLPDRPSRADLDSIGLGGEREDLAGMLVIDEAGGWLNARSWQGSERELIIDWLTQSRKRYWDIYLVAQAPAMLDKQVREAVCECVVRIRRTDRYKLAGMSLPRMHVAVVRYGIDKNDPVIERWFYRGTEAHLCFGSYRLFGSDSAHYSVLPARLTKWRSQPTIVVNDAGRMLVALGIVGAMLGLLVAPKLAALLLGFCGAMAHWFGRTVTPSSWGTWAYKLPKPEGMGPGRSHAKPDSRNAKVLEYRASLKRA